LLRKYFEQLVAYLEDKEFTSFSFQLDYEQSVPLIPEPNQLNQVETFLLQYIDKVFDPVYGGFAPAPIQQWREGQKFPMGFAHEIRGSSDPL